MQLELLQEYQSRKQERGDGVAQMPEELLACARTS